MALGGFELTAGILAATAVAGVLNARLLRAPAAAGLLGIGLAVSLGAALVERLWPAAGVGAAYSALERRIDYASLLLNLMLGWLLFAGALNIDLKALARRGWTTLVLATAGTAATAGLVALGAWGLAAALGYALPLPWALAFGVLISPTDPIAVLAMTKRTELQAELRAQLEGEALFNDGVAVVLFRAALAYALGSAGAAAGAGDMASLAGHAAIEALGGAALGLAGGALACGVIRLVDDWATETLATVAAAAAVYALALHLGLSGPIGVVVAGMLVGSEWSRREMSPNTRRFLFPFWHVADEGLNAVLFLGLGLVAWEIWSGPALGLGGAAVALAAPVLVLAARWLVIAVPLKAAALAGVSAGRALPAVLTWAGVRGGLSMAMALTIPAGPARPVILAATLAVVCVSILLQSQTMERLALRTGYGRPREGPEPAA